MKLSKLIVAALLIVSGIILFACGEGVKKDEKPVDIQKLANKDNQAKTFAIKESEIQATHPLNPEWVTAGQRIYELKCQSCHRLTEEKLVGPGWKGVTQRRAPVWIVNMICNTDMMLDKDPEAQKLLELCLVRMPNQNLMLDDARKVLEFQRSNDGEK